MSSRDDMVMVLRLGKETKPTAPVRARMERRLGQATRGKRGALGRLAKVAGAKRLAKSATSRVPIGRAAARGLGGAARGAAGRAVAVSAGTIVASGVVAAAVALKLITGQSFENMGQAVNNMLLGDLDEQARAEQDVRRRFQGDPDLSYLAGRQDGVSAQTQALARDLIKVRKRELDGQTALMTAIDIPGATIWDQLILRAKSVLTRAWNDKGGPAAMAKLEKSYGELTESSGGKGGFR